MSWTLCWLPHRLRPWRTPGQYLFGYGRLNVLSARAARWLSGAPEPRAYMARHLSLCRGGLQAQLPLACHAEDITVSLPRCGLRPVYSNLRHSRYTPLYSALSAVAAAVVRVPVFSRCCERESRDHLPPRRLCVPEVQVGYLLARASVALNLTRVEAEVFDASCGAVGLEDGEMPRDEPRSPGD